MKPEIVVNNALKAKISKTRILSINSAPPKTIIISSANIYRIILIRNDKLNKTRADKFRIFLVSALSVENR